jgi:hypothetical protein
VERVRSKILAGVAALALAGGIVAVVSPASKAASAACGSDCVSLASQQWGTGSVGAVKDATAAAGDKIILSAAGAVTSEDFGVFNQGTVAQFCNADVIEGPACTNWPSYEVVEYQYDPGGTQSGYCLGTAATATDGMAVTLQECGVDAETTWIPLTIDNINGFEPIVAGTDTQANTPFVLTAPSAVGGVFTTHKLDLVAGTFNPAEMWQLLSGEL